MNFLLADREVSTTTKKSYEKKIWARDEYADVFMKKIAAAKSLANPKGKGKGRCKGKVKGTGDPGPMASRPLPTGEFFQPDLKPLVPPGSTIWRGHKDGTWNGKQSLLRPLSPGTCAIIGILDTVIIK